ncbi:terpene synthase family protein [Streptomyces sp. CO7]
MTPRSQASPNRGRPSAPPTPGSSRRAAVPLLAWHSSLLEEMRLITCDVVVLTNEIVGLENHEARSDPNLIHQLMREHHTSRDEALRAPPPPGPCPGPVLCGPSGPAPGPMRRFGPVLGRDGVSRARGELHALVDARQL